MERLDYLMGQYRWHARSELMMAHRLEVGFEKLPKDKLREFKAQFTEALRQMEDSPASMADLTWTRRQRKLRRKLIAKTGRRKRCEISTALEVWCLSASSAAAAEVRSARQFSAELFPESLIS